VATPTPSNQTCHTEGSEGNRILGINALGLERGGGLSVTSIESQGGKKPRSVKKQGERRKKHLAEIKLEREGQSNQTLVSDLEGRGAQLKMENAWDSGPAITNQRKKAEGKEEHRHKN